MALLLPADCEFWVPQATGVSDRDLTAAIARVQALADTYTGRTLELTAFTAYLDIASFTRQIAVGQWPLVVDLTHALTVTENPDDTSPTVWPSTDYVVDASAGCLTCADGDYWPTGVRVISVAGYAGYTTTTLPEDLKDTLLEIVAWRLANRGGAGVQSESVDGYSMTLEPIVRGLPQSLARRLDPHRRLTLGWA